jgi:general secretion pathway protein N
VSKWHPATKFLLVGALLLLPYLLWTGGEDQVPVVAATAERPVPDEALSAVEEAPPAPLILPPLERITAVVERPLFSPTRRMPPPPPASEPEATEPVAEPVIDPGPAEPELRFFGTVRQAGAAAALVTYPATAEVARLRLGDAVGEWQVVAVERNRLELALGDERRSFEIFGAGMRAAPPEALPSMAEDDVPADEPYDDQSLPELE